MGINPMLKMTSVFDANSVKWNVKNECKILPKHRIEQYYEKNEEIKDANRDTSILNIIPMKELALKALWVKSITGIILQSKFYLY